MRKERDELAARVFEGVAATTRASELEAELEAAQVNLIALTQLRTDLESEKKGSRNLQKAASDAREKAIASESAAQTVLAHKAEDDVRMNDLQSQLNGLQDQLDQISNQCIEAESISKFESLTRQTIEDELRLWQDTHNVNGEVTDTLRSQLEEERGRNAGVDIEQEQIAHAEQEARHCREQMKEAQQISLERTKEMQEEKGRRLEMESSLQTAEENVKGLESKLTETQADRDALSAQVLDLQAAKSLTEDVFSETRQQLSIERKRLQQSLEQSEMYHQELQKWDGAIEENNALMHKLHGDLETARQQANELAGVDARAAALEAELLKLSDQTELIGLRNKTTAYEEADIQLQEELVRMKGELENAQQAVERKASNLASLKADLLSEEQKNVENVKENEALKLDLGTKMITLQEMEFSIEQCKEEQAQAIKNVAALESIIEKVKSEVILNCTTVDVCTCNICLFSVAIMYLEFFILHSYEERVNSSLDLLCQPAMYS